MVIAMQMKVGLKSHGVFVYLFSRAEDVTAHGSEVACVSLGRKTGRVMVTGGHDRKVNVWAVGKPQCIMVRS